MLDDDVAVNPFTPGFGEYPRVQAGRREIQAKWRKAFHPGISHHPARETLLLGDRGVGKTVLLDTVYDIAAEYGWKVVEVAGPGELLSGRVVDELWQPVSETRSTTVGIGAGPLRWEREWSPPPVKPPSTVRDAIRTVLGVDNPPSGVLVSIDEIHDVPRDELKVFGNDMQLLKRAGYRVGFVGAGLPDRLELRDPDKISTFISRATIESLSFVPDDDLQVAFVDTLATANVTVSAEVAEAVAIRSGGLPYATQVLGWNLFERRPAAALTVADVAGVLDASHERIREGLQLPYGPSPGQREYLAAMSSSSSSVRSGFVAQVLGRTAQQVAPIRSRLINGGYVTAPTHGEIEFAAAGYRALIATDATVQSIVQRTYELSGLLQSTTRSTPTLDIGKEPPGFER